MTILIIGAGAVASVMTRYLIKDRGIAKVICASKDIKRAKQFINHKERKIKLIFLDASRIGEIIKAAKGADLIINASLPAFNENIMMAALKVGANYQDLASRLLDLKTVEQLKFHSRFKKAKLVGFINTGVAPGITNLLARQAADKLDEVRAIRFRLLEEQKASELIFAWSAETILDELTAPPLVYENGKFIFTKPFGGQEEYQFPSPFGKRQMFSIYGDEVATIPHYIKVRRVDFKSSGTDIEFAKALYRLGLFNKKSISFDGRQIIPVKFFSKLAPRVPSPEEMRGMIKRGVIENAIFAAVVEVEGKQAERKITIKASAIFPDLKEISKKFFGATYISYPTGTAAYAFAKVIPKIKTYGVFPAEALRADLRKEVLLELESRGIVINESYSR
jgi:saccharopine dehydrogenase (NAD+, L-lysine-forming)